MVETLSWRLMRRLCLFDVEVFVLLSEKLNSNQVATDLGIPPSKVSRTLSSLRDLFNDPLFVRKQYGFEPTPLAVRIFPVMASLLGEARRLPGSSVVRSERQKRQKISISVPMTISHGLLEYLVGLADSHGDNLDIALRPWTGALENADESNGVSIAVYLSASSKRSRASMICHCDNASLVAAEEHPIWQGLDEISKAVLKHPYIVNECASYNDQRDPVAEYITAMNGDAYVAARVTAISDLISMLKRGKGFSFVNGKNMVRFFEGLTGLKVVPLTSLHMSQLQHAATVVGVKDQPAVYMECANQQGCPTWLLPALRGFMQEQFGG